MNLLLSLVVLGLTSASPESKPAEAAMPGPGEFQPMFNGKDLSGWVPVNVAQDTFSVRDGKIFCKGVPTGTMRTERQYENFIMDLEWRHLKPAGNSGVFVWGEGRNHLGQPFAKGIEVQILDHGYGNTAGYTTHGDIFPIWGAEIYPEHPRNGHPEKSGRSFPTASLSKPSPEWNHYTVIAVDGTIKLAVNGKIINGAVRAKYRKGYLCLESEGGEIEFRNLRLLELPGSADLKPEEIAPLAETIRFQLSGSDLRGWDASAEVAKNWQAQDWQLDCKGAGPDLTLSEAPQGDFFFQCEVQSASRPAFDIGGLEYGASLTAEQKATLATALAAKGWIRIRSTIQSGKLSIAVNDKTILSGLAVPAKRQISLKGGQSRHFAAIFIGKP